MTDKRLPYFTVVIALCLLIANSAFWFSRNIFNTEKFTQTTTEAVLSDSSIDAIARQITARISERKPLLASASDDLVNNIVGSILTSDRAASIFTRTISSLQTIITSSDPQSVEVNLVPLKDVLSRITAVAADTDIEIDEIPDSVVIVNHENLPNIYQMGSVLLWLGPLLFGIGALLFILLMYRAWGNQQALKRIFSWMGWATLITFLISMIVGPIFKPPFLKEVDNSNMRIVAENIYDAFLQTFNRQAWLLFITSVIFFGLYIWLKFKKSEGTDAKNI